MSDDRNDAQGKASAEAPARSLSADPPEIIQPPVQPHSDAEPLSRPTAGRRTGNMKGRHFGPRPVADPLDDWIPAARCTKAQRVAAEAAAAAAGLSLGAYQRKLLFGAPGARAHRKAGPNADALSRLLAALGRSGNNLNQLLRKVNSYDFQGQPELLEMHLAMKEAHAAHKEVCEAILSELGV